MATVVSLTQTKIEQLLDGWRGVSLSQDEINSLVAQLWSDVQTNGAVVQEFENVIVPELLQQTNAGAMALDNLLTNQLPTLEVELNDAKLSLEHLNTSVLPELREQLDSTITNVIERPNVYVQPEAPEDPDENERYLVVGDVWHDSDDNNRVRIWNGVEWSTFGIDIPDLSITVQKFKTSTHMIY